MVALVFSLSVHESAHAWTSNYFGDDLARLQGRISLNPISHVDPIGTLLFPALAFFTGAPLIGWAKPTPVNPFRLAQQAGCKLLGFHRGSDLQFHDCHRCRNHSARAFGGECR